MHFPTNQQVIDEFRANGGQVGGPFAGASLILLTTTGARTGLPRTSPNAYLRDGGRLHVFASNAGSPHHPAWFHNLRADPQVIVEIGRDGAVERYAAIASEVTGDERDRIYAQMSELAPAFAAYQAATTRVIPVVALEPVAAEDDPAGRNGQTGGSGETPGRADRGRGCAAAGDPRPAPRRPRRAAHPARRRPLRGGPSPVVAWAPVVDRALHRVLRLGARPPRPRVGGVPRPGAALPRARRRPAPHPRRARRRRAPRHAATRAARRGTRPSHAAERGRPPRHRAGGAFRLRGSPARPGAGCGLTRRSTNVHEPSGPRQPGGLRRRREPGGEQAVELLAGDLLGQRDELGRSSTFPPACWAAQSAGAGRTRRHRSPGAARAASSRRARRPRSSKSTSRPGSPRRQRPERVVGRDRVDKKSKSSWAVPWPSCSRPQPLGVGGEALVEPDVAARSTATQSPNHWWAISCTTTPSSDAASTKKSVA